MRIQHPSETFFFRLAARTHLAGGIVVRRRQRAVGRTRRAGNVQSLE